MAEADAVRRVQRAVSTGHERTLVGGENTVRLFGLAEVSGAVVDDPEIGRLSQ
jgi:hypothetical protein